MFSESPGKTIALFFIVGLSSVCGLSQRVETINLEDIPQRKVRKYVEVREIDKMKDFSLIHASCKKEINEKDFHINQKEFHLKYNIANVWNCYRTLDPEKTWNKKSIRFGLLISKCSNTVTYRKDLTYTIVDTGQVYFLNLRLLKGLFNIPVAFEIIDVDQNKQVVEFSYIDNNKSKGKQVLEFFDEGNGCTRIVHRSYFKSGSSFRDKFIYPMFHKKFIKEFHRDMIESLKDKSVIATIKG
jgi:hypothetical protein